jgi:2-dehydropantoate 2-reductase
VAVACGREAWSVARALDVAIGVVDPVLHLTRHGAAMPGRRPPVLLDHQVRRHSEIDYINGAVVRMAAEAAMAAPVNDAVCALVRAAERDFA